MGDGCQLEGTTDLLKSSARLNNTWLTVKRN